MAGEEGVLGKDYTDGAVICRQGDVGDRMYVVQGGKVVVAREDGGSEIMLAELGAGDIFGEMAVFDKRPRSATVRVKGSAKILTLDKRAFMRRVHEDPSLAYHILQKMSQRIRSLDEELVRLKGSRSQEVQR